MLGGLISVISERRLLFFFGIVLVILTVVGLIYGANVLYCPNAGRGVAVGSALVSVLFVRSYRSVQRVQRAYIECGWKN